MPVADMFWGDRYGQLRDPFGVLWGMNLPNCIARMTAPTDDDGDLSARL